MRRIFREPLFQFLLIGAGFFLVYNVVNKRQHKGEIVIDNNLISELSARWEMQWNREPQFDELTGVVQSYIGQEILYREALSMNLDHNDEIIKRRLAQKMEFLSDGMSDALQPTEKMLKEYYEKNKQNYTRPSVYTLRHVYFSSDKRNSPWIDAQRALASGNPENAGDNLSMPSRYTSTGATRLAVDFGQAFASVLDTLPVGKWTGPINSGYGIHLVFIEEKKPSGFFSFEEITDKVTADYNFDASKEFRIELLSTLLKNYTINIDVTDKHLKKVLSENF